VSDRIRSPSDDSNTSSEEEGPAPYNRLSRQTSEPVKNKAFPTPTTAVATSGGIVFPKRKKTLSDSSRLDSPLAMRVARAGGLPPTSFGGFARPSPASRRRRGSQSDTESTPEFGPGKAHRSTSSQSMHVTATSPTWSTYGEGVPTSPTSPGVDSTSFHSRAKSPEEVEQEEDETAEMQMDQDREMGDVERNEELEETDDAVGMLGGGSEALNPRLSRISVSCLRLVNATADGKTESTISLRTSHDKLQVLHKQNADLSRKLKESERQLALLG
jgi:hypothetical protein